MRSWIRLCGRAGGNKEKSEVVYPLPGKGCVKKRQGVKGWSLGGPGQHAFMLDTSATRLALGSTTSSQLSAAERAGTDSNG